MSGTVQSQKFGQRNKSAIRLVPPWFIEAGLYVALLYDYILAPILGLEIEKLGIVFLAGLASLCFLGFRERPADFFKTLVFPISLGISYLITQNMYHGESMLSYYVKPYIPWIFTLIVVQALSFRRGFLHRFAIFAVILGILVIPFMEFRAYGKEMARLALGDNMGPFSSSNAMGAWFGFCSVYFILFGAASHRHKIRLASWMIAMGCLLIEMLTVSRAALLATVLAIALGSREFLKRGFLPVIILVMLAGIAYGTGMFDQAINSYMMRGATETGRGYIWPKVFASYLNSPLVGVGASNAYIFIPEVNRYFTPHNGFLYIAWASGTIPLMFYAAYWIQAIWAVIKQQAGRTDNASVLLGMVVCAFLISQFSSQGFLQPWVVVTTVAAVTSRIPARSAPPRVDRDEKNKRAGVGNHD